MLNLNHLTDDALYGLLKSNNETAFNLLYQRYWKRMLFKAADKLKDASDAEEVVQDAFSDIWNARHRISIKHTFHTYIAAVVKYKIMAKMGQVHRRSVNERAEDLSSLHIADHSTEDWLRFQDLRSEIERAVKGLPEKCQLVFRMSREQGKSDKEIAADLELSPKTVEAHITRALKALRSSIGQFLSFF